MFFRLTEYTSEASPKLKYGYLDGESLTKKAKKGKAPGRVTSPDWPKAFTRQRREDFVHFFAWKCRLLNKGGEFLFSFVTLLLGRTSMLHLPEHETREHRVKETILLREALEQDSFVLQYRIGLLAQQSLETWRPVCYATPVKIAQDCECKLELTEF